MQDININKAIKRLVRGNFQNKKPTTSAKPTVKPTEAPKKKPVTSVIRCYTCGKEGHHMKDCRSGKDKFEWLNKTKGKNTNRPKFGGKKKSFYCKYCKKMGRHKSADCFNKPKNSDKTEQG